MRGLRISLAPLGNFTRLLQLEIVCAHGENKVKSIQSPTQPHTQKQPLENSAIPFSSSRLSKAMPNKATVVFGTPELLEAILLQLPHRDLLLSQKVNKVRSFETHDFLILFSFQRSST